jgi:hypothetical protein
MIIGGLGDLMSLRLGIKDLKLRALNTTVPHRPLPYSASPFLILQWGTLRVLDPSTTSLKLRTLTNNMGLTLQPAALHTCTMTK